MLKRTRTAACLLAGAAVLGCGASTRSNTVTAPTGSSSAALRGSPAPLAALHGQAGAILGGGGAAFYARLHALHGFPVVVNKWASWCGPCQSEFPVFGQVSNQLGRQVAFLGLDGRDQPQAATAFLARHPVSYPSYDDPDEAIARTLQAVSFYPETIFFDRTGRQVYLHAGPYLSAAALIHDVRFYAR